MITREIRDTRTERSSLLAALLALVAILLTWQIGEIKLRHAHEITRLKVEIESAYHEGSDDGYNTGIAEMREHMRRSGCALTR